MKNSSLKFAKLRSKTILKVSLKFAQLRYWSDLEYAENLLAKIGVDTAENEPEVEA